MSYKLRTKIADIHRKKDEEEDKVKRGQNVSIHTLEITYPLVLKLCDILTHMLPLLLSPDVQTKGGLTRFKTNVRELHSARVAVKRLITGV